MATCGHGLHGCSIYSVIVAPIGIFAREGHGVGNMASAEHDPITGEPQRGPWAELLKQCFEAFAGCLNGRAPLYLSDYCVPAAGADTRRQLRSSNRHLLAVPHYRLNTSIAGPFQLPTPQSGTLSRILSGTRPSV